jgi:hypothetical protein
MERAYGGTCALCGSVTHMAKRTKKKMESAYRGHMCTNVYAKYYFFLSITINMKRVFSSTGQKAHIWLINGEEKTSKCIGEEHMCVLPSFQI